MDPDQWELVGILTRTQGDDGDLLLKVKKDFPADHDFSSPVFIPVERKDISTPFFFESCERISKKHYTVRFDLVDDENRASRLIGLKVQLHRDAYSEQEKESQLLEKVQGYRVIDREKGDIGIIQGGIERPEQPVALVGDQNIPVPLTPDLLEQIDEEAKTLYMDLPEGLTEL